MILLAWWVALSLASTVVWCALMWRREDRTEPRIATTPVLHLADEGAKETVPEGLGMRRDVQWVELPADPEAWIEAVAK